MSLFSGLGQSKPTGGSLFGASGTANSQTGGGGGGLFGNSTAQQPQQPSQPQSGGPFSGLGAKSQPQSNPGVFGNLTNSQNQQQQQQQQQQPATGGVFGGLGASQNNATGGTNQQQPSGGSGMFGGLGGSQNNTTAGASQQQPGGGSGMFGGLGGTQGNAAGGTNQQQPGGGSGMFGGLGGTQGNATGGTNQQQSGGAPGLFGASILGNASNQQGTQSQQQGGQPAQAGAINSQPAYFNHLLERGKKRANQDKDGPQLGELPSLQLGLGDIARKVRDLGSGGSSNINSKGHTLLAASGVSTGATLRDLKSFSAKAGTAPLPSTLDAANTDLDTYFANQQAKSTQDLIAEALEQSKRDFDAFLEEKVQMNWEEQRRKIYEHFGLAKRGVSTDADQAIAGSRGAFGRSRRGRAVDPSRPLNGSAHGGPGLGKSVIGAGSVGAGRAAIFSDSADKANGNGQTSASEDRFVRDKQEKLAAKVKELNMARLQDSSYAVMENFRAVEVQTGFDNTARLVDAYNALIEITKESPIGGSGMPKERQYLNQYLDESVKIRKRILEGSLRSLEKAFFRELEVDIAKNPNESNIGGVPTAINKIRAYIRLRAFRKELGSDNITLQMLGDDYCWVLIFYLLRSGFVKEAAKYVADNERAIKNMDRNFPMYISCYANDADRRLTASLQNKMNVEYQSRTRNAPENSLDPYRIACLKVIGRCDLSRRSIEGISQTMEDWVWLQFALAREVNRAEEVRGEVFGLEELRNTFTEIGQRHFQDSQNSAGHSTFFYLQILAGQFERAVAYLYSQNYVSAVHFAIALSYHGLLRVSDFNVTESDPLTLTTQGKPQISFGRIVGYYTGDFRAALPEAATDYICLICMNSDLPGQAGKSYRELCHEALRELVLETREFALLLGDIRSDGQRIKGVIEQRLKLIKLTGEDEFLKTITVQAASVADDSGRITDAVLLYHLAEEYDSVIELINRALSDAVAVDIGEQHMRVEPSKPRPQAGSAQQQQQQQQQEEQNLGISLTSVDDPAVLARNMISVYDKNALYLRKIKQVNRDACGLLLRMHDAKMNVEAGRWAEALDLIHTLSLLPLAAHGALALIRNSATTFNALPTVIARNIGNLLLWTVTACVRQRELLLASAFEDTTRSQMADELLQVTKDLMVFAGMVRYKLPPKVFDALARAGQDGDGF